MKEKLFIMPEYTTSEEIKKIRKRLGLTQKDFAVLANASKPTVERWERSDEKITGPIVTLLKMLEKYPTYIEDIKVPAKTMPIRLWYMHKQSVCTLIDVNEVLFSLNQKLIGRF